METPQVEGSKFLRNVNGHMIKMATIPFKGTNPLNVCSSLESKGQWPWDLIYGIENVGPTQFAQMMKMGSP